MEEAGGAPINLMAGESRVDGSYDEVLEMRRESVPGPVVMNPRDW